MAASRWERGINPPTASIFLQLGKLAGPPECWYFWEQAGLTRSDVGAALPKRKPPASNKPQLESVLAVTGKRSISAAKIPTLAALPLYGTTAEIGSGSTGGIARENVLEYVVAPRSWCPHPDKTICLRMGGDQMVPLLHPGYTFAVDEAEMDADQLDGKLVLASHPQHGLVVRCLQRYGKTKVLVPENRSHPAIYVENEAWSLCGKVLWWFAKAP